MQPYEWRKRYGSLDILDNADQSRSTTLLLEPLSFWSARPQQNFTSSK